MRRSILLAAVALGLVFSGPVLLRADGPTAAASQPAPRPAIRKGTDEIRTLLDGLNLNDDQKAKVKDVLEDFQAKLQSWRQTNKDALQDLRKQVQAARQSNDPDQIKAAREKLQTLMQTAPKPKDLLDQLKDILAPDQLEKLKGEIQQFRQNRAKHAGEGPDAATQPAAPNV